MHAQLLIRRDRSASHISVGGNVDARSAEAFGSALRHDVRVLSDGEERIQLDLIELELDDGSAVAETVNAIRDLLLTAPVVVRNAPQMLAHTLYKSGMLRDGRLELEDPRGDEAPYS
jgi:hypothetical protein